MSVSYQKIPHTNDTDRGGNINWWSFPESSPEYCCDLFIEAVFSGLSSSSPVHGHPYPDSQEWSHTGHEHTKRLSRQGRLRPSYHPVCIEVLFLPANHLWAFHPCKSQLRVALQDPVLILRMRWQKQIQLPDLGNDGNRLFRQAFSKSLDVRLLLLFFCLSINRASVYSAAADSFYPCDKSVRYQVLYFRHRNNKATITRTNHKF